MTIFMIVPLIVEPDFVTLLVTITDMYAGSGPFGGGALFPGSVVKVAPHVGAAGYLAKPLNDDGPAPLLILFAVDHWLPQKFTVPVWLWSPMTNAPPPVLGALA